MIVFLLKLKRRGINKILFLFAHKFFLKLKVVVYKKLFSNNKAVLIKTLINQPTQFVGKGLIELNNVCIGIWPSPNIFNGVSYLEARSPEARLKIGHGTFINNNASIIVDKTSIIIGNNCLIGPNFFAVDSDFHGLTLEDRRHGIYECMPIHIENDVFIGEGVKVLKGVRIGQGAVVGTGSLVTRNVDDFCVVAGVPAKKIKELARDV